MEGSLCSKSRLPAVESRDKTSTLLSHPNFLGEFVSFRIHASVLPPLDTVTQGSQLPCCSSLHS